MGVDVPQRVGQMGFAARANGVPRHHNPYVTATDLAAKRRSEPDAGHELADAWWQGWDRADIELRNGTADSQ